MIPGIRHRALEVYYYYFFYYSDSIFFKPVLKNEIHHDEIANLKSTSKDHENYLTMSILESCNVELFPILA